MRERFAREGLVLALVLPCLVLETLRFVMPLSLAEEWAAPFKLEASFGPGKAHFHRPRLITWRTSSAERLR